MQLRINPLGSDNFRFLFAMLSLRIIHHGQTPDRAPWG
jgi:hypothetical protein